MTIKTIRIVILALLGAVAQWAWAQSPTAVSTDAELRTVIQTNGANITVTADIDLSNSTLSIPTGNTVTIDLNGHTLDRKLTSRGEGGGQVITVRSGAKLYLSNGTLKGGWGGHAGGLSNESGTAHLTNVNITNCKGDDNGGGICNLGGTLTMTGGSITNNTCYDHGDPAGGGGIFNAEGATATLTGVTITGNEDMVCGGGGICNYGTLNLDGCTITGNKARTVGGGIWSGNEKHLLKMQGANIITDNIAAGIPSNLFMKERRLITLTGSITGSRIGIMLDVAPNQFTDGYATYHNGEDPNTFFTYDKPWVDSLAIIQPEPYVLYVGEVIMRRKNLKGKVPYIEHSWDSENQKVISTVKILTEEIGLNDTPTNETQYKKLKSSDSYVDLGTKDSELHEYYVVEGDELNIYALDVIGPNVHIILRDSAYLHLDHDIGVEKGNTVYFHAQSTGSYIGKLTVGEGIGGETNDDGANIEIHGGNFDLHGTENSAAIGGKYTANGDITIYDGHIKATGEDSGVAGIGGGYGCTNYGNITIYGGKIEATGSAGIGGGPGCLNGNLTIWDGAITAHGKGESAGIGSNQFSEDYGAGTITINGGYIRAYGDTHGAGIGGGDGVRGGTLNVNGGRVDAYGGTDAAGIGGGEGGNGGIVNITGGYVYAEGNDYGAGIGGGQDGVGANVTITGGTVIAKAGRNQTGWRAIGPGSGEDDDYGTLELGDQMMVRYKIENNWSEPVPVNFNPPYGRKAGAWYHTEARIEPCTHQGATYTDNGNSISVGCSYCTASTMPYTFYSNGNWNDDSKWFSNFKPHNGNDVAVKAQATIPADYCANVGDITIEGGTITIAEGGQLIHKNNGVTATVQKNIAKYTVPQTSGETMTNGWYFITSPVTTSYTPDVTMLSNTYDLYRLNNTIWENWKQTGDHYHFDLENSRGYLYANSEDVTLEFKGTVLPSANSKNVNVNSGFNLIGNPLLHNVYADRPYYRMNDTRTDVELVENYQTTPIAPCTGIIVNADAAGMVTFTKEAPALANDNGSMQITLSKVKNERASTGSATVIDNAIVSFNAGTTLPKFRFSDNAEIFIPQDSNDYAIAFSDRRGDMPLHFVTKETGAYTISFSGENMSGVKLIDKLENAVIDLGENSSYTFIGSPVDSKDRFIIRFGNAESSEPSGSFAYQSGSDIIVSGEGELQVFDVMGRMVMTQHVNGVETFHGTSLQTGIYILKLNNKVQKIVIR